MHAIVQIKSAAKVRKIFGIYKDLKVKIKFI